MGLVYPESLGQTLDALNSALFFGDKLSAGDKREAVLWLASRQGLPGSYAGMFAPTALDFKHGVRLFTGERISSKAGTAHILGEEACRALRLLGRLPAPAAAALDRADAGMRERMQASPDSAHGRYCCGTCSCSVWRNISSGGLGAEAAFLRAGLASLHARRDGAGKWRGYPFHYAALSLAGMDLPAALAELRYCAPVWERVLRRKPDPDSVYAKRQHELARRVLARC